MQKKLSDTDVHIIRTHPRYRGSLKVLADRFGVSRNTISNVINDPRYYQDVARRDAEV